MATEKLKFTVAPPPASSEAIARFEVTISSRLPTQYREFLARQDGGIPEPNEMVGQDDLAGTISVDEFLSVESDQVESIRAVMDAYEDRLPNWAIPVANAAGGNVILLSIRGSNLGQVYFWDHEQEISGEPLSRVGDDLQTFLRKLVPASEAPIVPTPEVLSVWVSPDLETIRNEQ
jgi:cell wall assembly regulator SMI1